VSNAVLIKGVQLLTYSIQCCYVADYNKGHTPYECQQLQFSIM